MSLKCLHLLLFRPFTRCIVIMVYRLTQHMKHSRLNNASRTVITVSLFSLILGISACVYSQLGEPNMLTATSSIVISGDGESSANSRVESIQSKIKLDKQNNDLWFELGNEYMSLNEFENAALVYHYADRLSTIPQASIFAAQASARYYVNHQRIDQQVQTWIDMALEIDPDNAAALMLLATDHFLSARYEVAIEHWVRILDANSPTTDRETIINSINQAKRMK